ncbi:MAG: ATP-dependent Clp protease adaptor ClpS [Armatimonadetes bacterium]|nr:ATP-dependent Clp protease adaptor ClpS [Armatimonadota bacterium]
MPVEAQIHAGRGEAGGTAVRVPEATYTLPRPVERPTPTEDGPGTGSGDHVVIVFNNDFNTFDEVIHILQVATRCPRSEAELETWEIHHRGRSLVHHGDREECDRAAAVISSIGLRVAVEEM